MAMSMMELARRLDEVAQRFESLANRLDTTYLRREVFISYRELADAENQRLRDSVKAQGDRMDEQKVRITELEDGRKWLSRLVIGFIVLAILGAVFTVAKTGAHP